MSDELISLDDVKKCTRSSEAYELVQTFSVYRDTHEEFPRKIHIEVWRGDRGYHVQSRDEYGETDMSNPRSSIREAFVTAHWGTYDKPHPETVRLPTGVE